MHPGEGDSREDTGDFAANKTVWTTCWQRNIFFERRKCTKMNPVGDDSRGLAGDCAAKKIVVDDEGVGCECRRVGLRKEVQADMDPMSYLCCDAP